MYFNSYQFIFFFLPATLIGFFLIKRFLGAAPALTFAILASIIFYAYWDSANDKAAYSYVPVLCGSIAINYGLGTFIRRRSPLAGTVLTLAVGFNLIMLGYYKYSGFLAAQHAWPAAIPISAFLPLAISFYTFQQIAYLVDCRHGKIYDNSFLRYAFTVTFFPHLIAGPIVRMREISPQFPLLAGRPVLTDLSVGLAVFVIGLGKKVIVADYFGQIGSPLFKAAETAGGVDAVTAWVAALAYTLQLYFDFSGYSDMAIGLSRMFGFRLAVNFLSPYKAANIAEFWRRWHITLSRFLRDYIYIPLGGNRAGSLRISVNLLITMGLGGLWHGASWTFVVWGLYHGALLCAHRIWRQHGHPLAPRVFSAMTPIWTLLTFLCVVVGWVLFRAADFTTAATLLKGMAGMTGVGPVNAFPRENYIAIAVGLAACWLLPNVYQVFFRWRPALLLRPQIPLVKPTSRFVYAARFGLPEAVFVSCVLLGCLYVMRTSVSEFLYFMF